MGPTALGNMKFLGGNKISTTRLPLQGEQLENYQISKQYFCDLSTT